MICTDAIKLARDEVGRMRSATYHLEKAWNMLKVVADDLHAVGLYEHEEDVAQIIGEIMSKKTYCNKVLADKLNATRGLP